MIAVTVGAVFWGCSDNSDSLCRGVGPGVSMTVVTVEHKEVVVMVFQL